MVDKSAVMKLGTCLTESSGHFDDIVHRLARFGDVWEAVSPNRQMNHLKNYQALCRSDMTWIQLRISY